MLAQVDVIERREVQQRTRLQRGRRISMLLPYTERNKGLTSFCSNPELIPTRDCALFMHPRTTSRSTRTSSLSNTSAVCLAAGYLARRAKR